MVASAQLAAKPLPPPAASSAALLLKNGASKSTAVVRGKELRRSLLSDVALSAADQASQALQAMTTSMGGLSASLALGASPAAGYLAAGDAGVWAAAASSSARGLAALPLQAGATAAPGAALDAASNAQLRFAGSFVGPCTVVDDNGAESSVPCEAGPVTVAAQYYEDASIFTDARLAANLSLIANMTGLNALTPASGVVVVNVSGSDPDRGLLPCAPGAACSVRIALPLTGAVAEVSSNGSLAAPAASRRRLQQLVINDTSELACLRIAGLDAYQGYPADPAFQVTEVVLGSASNSSDGQATCTVTLTGT